MITYKDYYETLGLSKDATKKDIRKAYLKLAKKYHPDVSSEADAEQQFKDVQEAYEVLYDDAKRKEYDQLGDSGYWHADRGRHTDNPYAANAEDFTDFFHQWFGARGNRTVFYDDDRFADDARQSPARADEEASLYISLEQALQGANMQINIDGRHLQVKIPKGVRNGQKIRLKGQSSRKARNGKRGDLYVILLLKPHPRFKVDHDDLTATLQIAPWHAVLGTKAQILTLDGTRISIRIPAGITSGQKIRIARQGLMKADGQRGDLMLEMEIVVPKVAAEQERELYEQLAKVNPYEPVVKSFTRV